MINSYSARQCGHLKIVINPLCDCSASDASVTDSNTDLARLSPTRGQARRDRAIRIASTYPCNELNNISSRRECIASRVLKLANHYADRIPAEGPLLSPRAIGRKNNRSHEAGTFHPGTSYLHARPALSAGADCSKISTRP